MSVPLMYLLLVMMYDATVDCGGGVGRWTMVRWILDAEEASG